MGWPRFWSSRDRAELERLRESEARYRVLADAAGDLVIQYDLNGVIQYASPSAAAFGHRPEDLVGRNSLDFFHPDDAEQRKRRLEGLRSGASLPRGAMNERRLWHGDGRWIWVQGHPTVVRNKAGEPIGAVTILRDITERRQLEDQLRATQAETDAALVRMRESEARYRLVADHLRDVVVQYDVDGIIRYVSPSVAHLGYRPEDMVGRPMADFGEPTSGQMMPERLGDLKAGRTLVGGLENEFRVRKADGSWVWMQGNPTAIVDDAGRPLGVVSMLRDVEERRALEGELTRKREQAEAAVIAKAEFLANMSHEIRTPLTAVVGFASLIAKMQGLPDKARVYVDRIARGGEALTSIVNNVLDFSRVEAGQLELKPEPFEARALVAETLGLVHDAAVAKSLTLTAHVADGVPRQLLADAGRTRQVLLNLLSNAVKFTRDGEVRIEVTFAAGRLRLAVRDTGVGVPKALADRLFQRFSQIDGSNARRFGGVGLGLAISKGLVELMGGEIGMTSIEGEGSTFWFEIPAPEAREPEPVVIESEDELSVAPMRVLVVDDARPNRELILALLGPFHLKLTEAADGVQAVEAARSERYDLVLMDLQMPGMDGMAATRAIRETSDLNRETPILAVSASVLPSDVEACRAAGMNDHIPKPINARELIGKVAHWTRNAPGAAVSEPA
ncbi:MAG: PAS domain S-box protein [Caulobacterales bacterium]|nr:PAS domain S-box protein [Caulobacterales bacterium]